MAGFMVTDRAGVKSASGQYGTTRVAQPIGTTAASYWVHKSLTDSGHARWLSTPSPGSS